MIKLPVIAIDGHSSTGKSSISDLIAKELHLIHMDTGALYRAVTLFGIRHHLKNNMVDIPQLIKDLNQIHLIFKSRKEKLSLFLNGECVDKEIRDPRVSQFVSDVAKEPAVRAFLLSAQRDMAKDGGIVMDGRDIGTVVLPDADYKFFLTASPDIRADRRFKELKGKGITTNVEDVKQNLLMRDKIDSERASAPLKVAKDAIVIDNSKLTKAETLALILSYIH